MQLKKFHEYVTKSSVSQHGGSKRVIKLPVQLEYICSFIVIFSKLSEPNKCKSFTSVTAGQYREGK